MSVNNTQTRPIKPLHATTHYQKRPIRPPNCQCAACSVPPFDTLDHLTTQELETAWNDYRQQCFDLKRKRDAIWAAIQLRKALGIPEGVRWVSPDVYMRLR